LKQAHIGTLQGQAIPHGYTSAIVQEKPQGSSILVSAVDTQISINQHIAAMQQRLYMVLSRARGPVPANEPDNAAPPSCGALNELRAQQNGTRCLLDGLDQAISELDSLL